MQKSYLKRIIGIITLFTAVLFVALFFQDTVANLNNADYRTLKSFYKEKRDTLDVVVMGASEIVNGYSAAEAYRTAGYTSFPFAFSVNTVYLWKYELEEIEKRQHPKLLLIETNGAVYIDDKQLHSTYCINNFLESMPMSLHRIKACREMSEEPLERLFPIIKYHYKWTQLRRIRKNTNLMLHRQGRARLRGAYSFTYYTDFYRGGSYPPVNNCSPLNEGAEAALYDFLEQCKNSTIEKIVFMEYPHIICDEETQMRQQRNNRVQEIVRSSGFEYIDFNKKSDEMGLDYSADFHDPDHMLSTGQKKTSDYIAKFIRKNYLSETKKQADNNIAEWDDSADLILKYYELSKKYIEKNRETKDNPVHERLYEDYDTIKTLENG